MRIEPFVARGGAVFFAVLGLLQGAAARTEEQPYYNSNPAWSPDGSEILFYSNRTGAGQLYRINANGGQERPLKPSAYHDAYPAYSPDGVHVAFTSKREGSLAQIHVMKADGTGDTLISNGPYANAVPTWSPSGKTLAFESKRNGNADVYVVSSDGTNLKRITTSPDNDFSPTWLPDGAGLVFQSNRTGHYQIYRVALAETSVTQMTHVDGHAYSPSVSPQGSFIACIVMDRDQRSAIHVMALDGTGLRPVSGWMKSSLHGVAVSPDGKTLAFMSDRDGAVDIFTMPATGGRMVNLTGPHRR